MSSDYPTESSQGIGGIGAHTSTLAHAISELGHDVTVLTEAERVAASYLDGRVQVKALHHGPRRLWGLGRWLPVSWIRRSFGVWNALQRLHAERPLDLVSFPDAYGEGFRYSCSPFAPFAVQLFGPSSLVYRWDGRPMPRIRSGVEAWLERRTAARATLTISATRRFATLIAREWSLDPARLRIIRNPLDLGRFRPPAPGAVSPGRVVLFVGHLQRLKGLDALGAAIPMVLAEHPDVEFHLIGNDTTPLAGQRSMKRRLEETLEERGVRDRVRFFDPVPQSELVPRYQGCAVFVLPSLNDVYPNAVLEAMACGRPCVVTETVGAAELVEESRAGLVVAPDRPEDLAGAISEILRMPVPLRQEMGARARATVEKVCATSTIAAQTILAYREVIRPMSVGRRMLVDGAGRGV